MISDPTLRGQRWYARRMLSTSDLLEWGAEHWCEWFSDGLDVWFSGFSSADRALAFAPLRVTPERQHMAEAVSLYLKRFYDHKDHEAATAFDIKNVIEEGASKCLQTRVLVRSCERAHFVLEIFYLLQARNLVRLARTSLLGLSAESLEDTENDEYLSLLTYILFENNAAQEADHFQDVLEARLRRCENFRPALFYVLQFKEDDILLSLDSFYELTRSIRALESSDVWHEVAEEFNERFGRKTVVENIDRVTSLAVMELSTDLRGIVPAALIRPFYPELSRGSLFEIERGEFPSNREALTRRGISA